MSLTTRLEHNLISKFKLKHLQLLVTVAEQGNISKAAEHMHIAQPAVTKLIKDLEANAGVTLFHRSKQGVAPTDSGAALIKHAKIILSQVKYASEDIVSTESGMTGHITFGTLLAASPLLLPQTLARIKAERPEISISVVEGTHDQLIPALRVGDIDVILGRQAQSSADAGVSSEVLYHEPVSVVVRKGHPLMAQQNLQLADLLNYPWILPLKDTALREEVDNAFLSAGLTLPKNTIESVSILTNRKLLTFTDMIAVMPFQVIRFYEEIGLLERLPIELQAKLGPVGASVRDEAEQRPLLQYVLQVVREVAMEIKSVS